MFNHWCFLHAAILLQVDPAEIEKCVQEQDLTDIIDKFTSNQR